MTGDDVRVLFTTLASEARPAGSDAESAARTVCRSWLERDGFDVSEVPFRYSAWPGFYATPLLGILLLLVSLYATISVLDTHEATNRVMAVAFAAIALIAGGGLLVGRFGTTRLPWMIRTSTLLEASRGHPTVWLIAHLDSKSQPVSLLVRAAGSVAFAGAWVMGLAGWLATDGSRAGNLWVGVLAAVGAISAVPIALSWIVTGSDGALDNASGVATVLAAARIWPADVPVGVVITSGEELGLAGARAWAAGRPAGVAINCDGVDDIGPVTVTLGRRRRGGLNWPALAVKRACGQGVRVRRILPGVLLDAVALSDAGWAVCTVSKGTIGSLARTHTGRDNLSRMDGTGIAETARMILALGGAIVT